MKFSLSNLWLDKHSMTVIRNENTLAKVNKTQGEVGRKFDSKAPFSKTASEETTSNQFVKRLFNCDVSVMRPIYFVSPQNFDD